MKSKLRKDFFLLEPVSGQPELQPEWWPELTSHVTPHVGAHDEAHDTVAFIKLQQSKQERP
ncbi:MAG: hypothetical protein JZU70_05205 [Chlorobium sp.]|nr:hypothetical protein [Chlorobium sp.]